MISGGRQKQEPGVAHPGCERRRGSASSRPRWRSDEVVAAGMMGRSWPADGGGGLSGGAQDAIWRGDVVRMRGSAG